LGAVAGWQDHHQPHSGWGEGNHRGYGRQYSFKPLIQNSFQDQTGIFPYVAELLWHQQKGVPMAGISGAKRGKPECDFR
jgi:hypothetical protein